MDDGANPHHWKDADLLILGVSRSGKTPLSIYLGQRGYKVANLPLVPGLPLPKARRGVVLAGAYAQKMPAQLCLVVAGTARGLCHWCQQRRSLSRDYCLKQVSVSLYLCRS